MILSALGGWLIAYVLPVAFVFGIIGIFSRRPGTVFRMTVVHTGLLVSIILSQYLLYLTNRPFPWHFYLSSILFFAIVTIGGSALLGCFGFLYVMSALLQQITLLSIAHYLSGSFHFWLVVLLVVPIYAAGHLLERRYWQIKIPATLIWGTLSIALFAIRADILLNASLHALLGSILIYVGIMYPQSDFTIKRTSSTPQ